MARLIGLVGKKGSGKTTAAEHLIAKGFKEVAFAEPLKKITAEIYGFSYDMLLGDTPEKRIERKTVKDPLWGHTGVQALQYLGTDVLRNNFDKDIWIKIAKRKIDQYLKDGISVVLSDVRFGNEIEFIREMGGTILVLYENDIHIQSIDDDTMQDLKMVRAAAASTKGETVDNEIIVASNWLDILKELFVQIIGPDKLPTSDQEIVDTFMMHTHASEISFQNCIEKSDIKIKNTKSGIVEFHSSISEKLSK